MQPRIPTADEQLVVRLWPTAGQALGLGKSATYDAAKRGDIPGLIHVGRRALVATAALRRHLHLDLEDAT